MAKINLNKNIKTHFKRHGSASWLELQGLPKDFYAESSDTFNYVKIVKYHEIPKTWKDKIYYETHSETILYKKYNNSKEENFKELQEDFNKILPIEIENYIESYYIGAKEGDKDILNNIDITDYTVHQVIEEFNINLNEYFKGWRPSEDVKNLLNVLSENLLNTKFRDLYQLIHWCDIKKDYKEKLLQLA